MGQYLSFQKDPGPSTVLLSLLGTRRDTSLLGPSLRPCIDVPCLYGALMKMLFVPQLGEASVDTAFVSQELKAACGLLQGRGLVCQEDLEML